MHQLFVNSPANLLFVFMPKNWENGGFFKQKLTRGNSGSERCLSLTARPKDDPFQGQGITAPKFNSSPLKSDRNPIGKPDRLLITISQGLSHLNFRGVNFKWVIGVHHKNLVTRENQP